MASPQKDPHAPADVASSQRNPHVHAEPDLEVATTEAADVDYTRRANWLRAAVLGANDGLVSVASLMVGVGAVSNTAKAMAISGLAGLVAGAFSMALGEFVSVYTQYDINKAQLERQSTAQVSDDRAGEVDLPSPTQAALASALAFVAGGVMPLLGGGFINSWGVRVGVVGGVTSIGLFGFGAAGGYLGGAPMRKSAMRVLIGGWIAMLVTYGVLRLFGEVFDVEVSAS